MKGSHLRAAEDVDALDVGPPLLASEKVAAIDNGPALGNFWLLFGHKRRRNLSAWCREKLKGEVWWRVLV